MSKHGNNFLLISCKSCQKAHGSKKVASKCPRCGNFLSSNHEILASCNDANDLQEMVMIYNMPKELREGFEDMLRKKDSKSMNVKKDDRRIWLGLARNSVAPDNEIQVDILSDLLQKNGQLSSVQVVLEQLSIEGFLIRGSNNSWMLLE